MDNRKHTNQAGWWKVKKSVKMRSYPYLLVNIYLWFDFKKKTRLSALPGDTPFLRTVFYQNTTRKYRSGISTHNFTCITLTAFSDHSAGFQPQSPLQKFNQEPLWQKPAGVTFSSPSPHPFWCRPLFSRPTRALTCKSTSPPTAACSTGFPPESWAEALTPHVIAVLETEPLIFILDSPAFRTVRKFCCFRSLNLHVSAFVPYNANMS